MMNSIAARRPFCFLTQFWGQRYRDYFVDLCLPSLLAPGNLPILRAADGHRLLIAAPKEDWEIIEHLPVMEKARQYVTPTLIETPAPTESGYEAVLRHQTYGLKRVLEGAYDLQSFGCAVWPDTIISDGMVVALLRFAERGHHLVMQPTIRLAEESVLGKLAASGLLRAGEKLSSAARAIVVPPRMVADLSIRHLHPEAEIFEEGHPHQPPHPPYRFWRVPNRRGIILHVFSATPVLMDFAVVASDHAACLDQWDWESVYIGRAFSHCGGLHVVTDSDECGILSITPAAVNHAACLPVQRFGAHWMPETALLRDIRGSLAAYSHSQQGTVRGDLFRASVCWHADDLDEEYAKEQLSIDRLIDRAAGDYYSNGNRFPSRISFKPKYLMIDLFFVLESAYRLFGHICMILRALGGHPADAERVRRRINLVFSRSRAQR
jgi:hypothetical protein